MLYVRQFNNRNNGCKYYSACNNQKCFNDELHLQLRFITPHNFSYANFLCTINCLCRGEVDKVYARNEQDEGCDQPQYVDQFVTDCFVAVISCCCIIMHSTYRL